MTSSQGPRSLISTRQHHRIPLHSLEKKGLCTGTLVFSVGTQDEPLALSGITHLVEHMVLLSVEHLPIAHGGTVDHESIEFYATGQPHDVGVFLNAVAHTISNFAQTSNKMLRLAKSIIETENPHAYADITAGMLTYRFGAQGPGKTHLGVAPTSSINKAEVIAWANQWLITSHAAISFTTEPPETLEVHLPRASAPKTVAHPAPTAKSVMADAASENASIHAGLKENTPKQVAPSPSAVVSHCDGIALSLIVPATHTFMLSSALEYELLRSLRRDQGLIYSVEPLIYSLTRQRTTSQETDTGKPSITEHDQLHQLDLILDPLVENTFEVFKQSTAMLNTIAAQGFSTQAIGYAQNLLRIQLAQHHDDPSSHLDRYTLDALHGRETPTLDELQSRLSTQNNAELTAVLNDALATLLVAVTQDSKISTKKAAALGLGYDAFTIWQRSITPAAGTKTTFHLQGAEEHPFWVRRTSKTKLTLTFTHLLKKKQHKTRFIELASIRLVGVHECGCISLLDQRGRSTRIDTSRYKHSKSLLAALLARFDAQLIRTFPAC